MRQRLRTPSLVALLVIAAATLAPAATLVLSVPVVAQQYSQWCWAGSSQAVLSYYGQNVSQCEIANYASGTQAGDCCAMGSNFSTSHPCNQPNYMWGSSTWSVPNGSLQGILANWGVSSNARAYALSQTTAVSEINSDRPFVMRFGWASGGGHFLVGSGYEADGTYLDYMDPWPGHGNTVSLYSWVVSAPGDHTWTHTLQITTNPPSVAPNLTFIPPTDWTAPVLLTTTQKQWTDTTWTDTPVLRTTDQVYAHFSGKNDSPFDVSSAFYVQVALDGGSQNWSFTYSSAPAGTPVSAINVPLDKLAVGTHTLRATLDSTDAVRESNENDNEYVKTFRVLPPPTYFLAFNSDASPDILWRNRITGEVTFWLMGGTQGDSVASTVTMAGPQDRNWKIAAIADMNLDGYADLVWRNASTGSNVVWFMNGTSYAGWAALPAVTDMAWSLVGAGDFNGDGRPDLVWRNRATGDDVVWYMDGCTYLGYGRLLSVADARWKIVAVDDFTGDGKADLLWRNTATGDAFIWYLNGVTYVGYLPVPAMTLDWQVAGSGDYNGDHQADIIWRNTVTGENQVCLMNAGTLVGTITLPGATNTDLTMNSSDSAPAAVGDFNVDGSPDILWHNTSTGANLIWYMNDSAHTSDGAVDNEPDLNWKSVAVADFNQDGLPDIVWRNSATGQNRIWLMTGRSHTGDMNLPTIADTNWQIVGVGDFNRDGHPDLAWRNFSTGANVIWFLRNGAYYDWTAPPTIADTNWQIVAVGDFNGDGWPDLFWRNQATGVNIAWFLVNGVYAGWGQPPTIADTTWRIVGAADFNGDGKADLLWRNATTGANLLWYLVDGAYIDWASLPSLETVWKTGSSQ